MTQEQSKSLLRFRPRTLVLAAILLLLSLYGAAAATSLYSRLANSPQNKLSFQWPFSLPGLNRPSASPAPSPTNYQPQTTEEQAVISAVKRYSPAVVSIIITKDLPVYEQYYTQPFGNSPFGDFFNDPFFQIQIPQYRQNGTQKQEVGGGSGFLVSSDGIVVTNKHVVLDIAADYTVLTNDGQKYPAKVLARDPVQDLAILKIDRPANRPPFPVVKLGDSSQIEIGQFVIAIGNALGEFRNTVSVGVVSGLSRTITASGSGTFVETLEDVIQTDAAINPGNSGGPLLNLKGEVVGINTAMVQSAQSISFAIPINVAKRDIQQAQAAGKITYPFLGVRYVLVNDQVQRENKLLYNYGAWIKAGTKAGEAAVTPGSAADKAGLKEGDIILQINNEKITLDNSLAKIIQKYNPSDTISLRVWSNGQEKTVSLVLGERSQ